MAQDGNQFDPFSTRPEDWGLKPGDVLIASSPSWNVTTVKHGDINVQQQFFLAYRNDWMGLLPWADMTPGDTYLNIVDGLGCFPNFDNCKFGLNESMSIEPKAMPKMNVDSKFPLFNFLQ